MNNWTKLFTLGTSGTGNAQLDRPTSLAVDAPYVYIADVGNSRILKWKLQGGDYVDKIDGVKAYGIAVAEKYLYINDAQNSNILKYDKHTLSLITSMTTLTSSSNLIFWRDYLWVVDDTDNKLYKLDPNDLSIVGSLSISGVTDAYEDIAASGDYLYILTDAGYVYRVTEGLQYDNRSVDLSAYLTDYYYISNIGEYLIVAGNDAEIVLIDRSLQVIANETLDTDDWSSIFDAVVLDADRHVFLAADYTGDQLVGMYGYDRNAGEASGDAITINGDSDQWTFGDDVIIGGSEANLTTKQFIRTSEAKPHSRNLWKRG